MGGVEQRVKEFLTTWQRRKIMKLSVDGMLESPYRFQTDEEIDREIEKIHLYCDCGVELVDGNFVLIDGTLRCLVCHEKLTQQTPSGP